MRRIIEGLKKPEARGLDAPEGNSAQEWRALAVWFGTILLTVGGRTRGAGALGLAILISRSQNHWISRLESRVEDLSAAVEEDLEDRAAVEDAVDDLAARCGALDGRYHRALSEVAEVGRLHASHLAWHTDHDALLEQRLSGLEVEVVEPTSVEHLEDADDVRRDA